MHHYLLLELDVCVIIPCLIFLCLSTEKGAIIAYENVEDTNHLKLYQDRHRPFRFLKNTAQRCACYNVYMHGLSSTFEIATTIYVEAIDCRVLS